MCHVQNFKDELIKITIKRTSPVCKRDFKTSAGIATIQLQIPAVPPAKRVLPTLKSDRLKNKNKNIVNTLNINKNYFLMIRKLIR